LQYGVNIENYTTCPVATGLSFRAIVC